MALVVHGHFDLRTASALAERYRPMRVHFISPGARMTETSSKEASLIAEGFAPRVPDTLYF